MVVGWECMGTQGGSCPTATSCSTTSALPSANYSAEKAPSGPSGCRQGWQHYVPIGNIITEPQFCGLKYSVKCCSTLITHPLLSAADSCHKEKVIQSNNFLLLLLQKDRLQKGSHGSLVLGRMCHLLLLELLHLQPNGKDFTEESLNPMIRKMSPLIKVNTVSTSPCWPHSFSIVLHLLEMFPGVSAARYFVSEAESELCHSGRPKCCMGWMLSSSQNCKPWAKEICSLWSNTGLAANPLSDISVITGCEKEEGREDACTVRM